MKTWQAITLFALVVGAATLRTPSLRMGALCRGDLQGRCYYYLQCDYYGIDGSHRFVPDLNPDEDCPVVKFFPLNWAWARR